jgi:hypothetical protein
MEILSFHSKSHSNYALNKEKMNNCVKTILNLINAIDECIIYDISIFIVWMDGSTLI